MDTETTAMLSLFFGSTGGFTLPSKHIYVLDTSVLLHSPNSLYSFQEHDVIIPIEVIDELDRIKTKPEGIGYSAREVFRNLDKYKLDDLTSCGVKVTDLGGKLFIYNNEFPFSKGERPTTVKTGGDTGIINSTLSLKKNFPRRKISIVSKDTGLRVRAQAHGILAENYRFDLLKSEPYQGVRDIIITNDSDWSKIWNETEILVSSFTDSVVEKLKDLSPNEYIIFHSENINDRIAVVKNGLLHILPEKPKSYMGITPKNSEQICAVNAIMDPFIPLIAVCGKAGSGKTLIALSTALTAVNNGLYKNVILIKPIVAVGKDLGYLPGSKSEKIQNWLGNFKDNLDQLKEIHSGKDKDQSEGNILDDMIEEGLIEVESLTYIQGRSLVRSVLILDECQNISPKECRMVVERCGKGSKIVLLGDLSQVENTFLDKYSNGLAHALEGGKFSDLTATISLKQVERSKLAEAASEIFNRPEAQQR